MNDSMDGDPILNHDITEQEIDNKALTQLKPRKAAGIDTLIPELFINGKSILLPFLTKLFQNIFNSGMYPEGWTQGILQLIYKNGDKNNPNNYRDITLMSCFGKLFDQVLYNKLKCWESDQGGCIFFVCFPSPAPPTFGLPTR